MGLQAKTTVQLKAIYVAKQVVMDLLLGWKDGGILWVKMVRIAAHLDCEIAM